MGLFEKLHMSASLCYSIAWALLFSLAVQCVDYYSAVRGVAAGQRSDTMVPCGTNFRSACPEGWAVEERSGVSRRPPRDGEGQCEWSDGEKIRCIAPPAYRGPCRTIEAPPCELNERTLSWSSVCKVTWFADSVPTCAWRRCSPPKCNFANEEEIIKNNTKCAGFITIVQQIPPTFGRFNTRRRVEFMETLFCNLNNPVVKEVHLLEELSGAPLNRSADLFADLSVTEGMDCPGLLRMRQKSGLRMDPCGKLRFISYGLRLTFQGVLEYVSKQEGLFLASNGDISIGDGFVKTQIDGWFAESPDLVIPITRYEDLECTNPARPHTYLCDCGTSNGNCMDTYLFKAPIPQAWVYPKPHADGLSTDLEFPFGAITGGENVFMENLVHRGAVLQSMLPCFRFTFCKKKIGKYPKGFRGTNQKLRF